MTTPLPETTLAWLRQTAKFEGAVTAQVILNLLDRVEALEARDKEDANCWASVRESMHRLRERIEALEQRPVPGTVELADPTPEAAPEATDKELRAIYSGGWGAHGPALRACYNLGRKHGAASAQPAHAIPLPQAGEGEV
jgi:hypothetical protein